jgi:ectoine hydroxylase-related dioxygenase (phytanoyl-CoA dioxygenase family)
MINDTSSVAREPILKHFKSPVLQPDFRDLTQGEIDAFRRDGVICLRQLYAKAWLDVLADELDHIGAKDPRSGTQIRSAVWAWLTRDIIRDFILFGPTAKPVGQALGSERLNTFGDQIFIKDRMLMEPTPWHHDSTFFPVKGNQVASVWTALDPVTTDGSALEFVAGSHLWPQRYKAIGLGGADYSVGNLEDLPDIESRRKDFNIVSWDLEPGDALLFHGLTLHGSRGNSTVQTRRAISTRWTGDDVTYNDVKATPLNHGLKNGDAMSGPMFPQVFPTLIDEEIAVRLKGPLRNLSTDLRTKYLKDRG